MPSTYSTTLRLELIGSGEQDSVWGNTTNSNLGTLIEQAITGVEAITMVDTDYTLTAYNGLPDEARNAILVIAGTNTAVRNIIAPLVEKTYTIKNATVGGYSVVIKTSTGTGITVLNGTTVQVFCDGTNFYQAVSGSGGNFTVNGNLGVTGSTAMQALSGTTGTFSGAVAGSTFTGAGTGLTGTAAALSIGGNAATATNATNAANAGVAASAVAVNTGSWSITESGGNLIFQYGGVTKFRLEPSGLLRAANDLAAFQSI